MIWARGKRSRGAIKVHTLLDLRGNIPTFIYISDGKYHDVNALDEIEIIPKAIYVMDKAYVDFRRLYTLNEADSFFCDSCKRQFSV
ncbi:MAG: transposase [Bacteroidales bacterium]|nr:transposase [Bacteroidales bacterium]